MGFGLGRLANLEIVESIPRSSCATSDELTVGYVAIELLCLQAMPNCS